MVKMHPMRSIYSEVGGDTSEFSNETGTTESGVDRLAKA